MRQTFAAASTLLDEITKINRAWYTRDDLATLLTLGKMKEQHEKDHECDEKMAKIMTQIKLLIKHVICGGRKGVNAIEVSDGVHPDDVNFDTIYNEEVQYIENQVRGSGITFERQAENQG